VGDRIIWGVARILAGSVRENVDHVARYGGDEFALILPETDTEGAVTVAERIRAAVEKAVLDPDGARLKVTASIGVASMAVGSGPSEAEMVEWADRCLYRAKAAGRNRVVADEPEPPLARAS
jgi:diguanylate cyclase (GGDEF)-like protein